MKWVKPIRSVTIIESIFHFYQRSHVQYLLAHFQNFLIEGERLMLRVDSLVESDQKTEKSVFTSSLLGIQH